MNRIDSSGNYFTSTGTLDEVTGISGAVTRQYSNGNLLLTGAFDEVTKLTTYSALFNGSSQYLTIPNSTAPQLGTSDFTIEFWLKSSSTAAYQTICGNATTPNGNSQYSAGGWALQIGADGSHLVLTQQNIGIGFLTSSTAVSDGVWRHVAITRNGTVFRMFVNGNLESSYTALEGYNIDVGTPTFCIGIFDNGSYFNGYISNFRLIIGSALYTSAFTAPSSPLTAIAGTSLLTCQSATIIDNSTNALAITNVGSVTTTSSVVPTIFGLISGLVSRLYSNGAFLIAGALDEVTNVIQVSVNFLVVAGGGGGGGTNGGGGGAGGMIVGNALLTLATTYNITVGGGGTAGSNFGAGYNNPIRGGNGSNSVLVTASSTYTAIGGGGGGTFTYGYNGGAGSAGAGGGSGGGGNGDSNSLGWPGGAGLQPASASGGYGNAGGNGTGNGARAGGGGGAGGAGSSGGGAGGTGLTSSITGTSVYYAGGGAGCGGGGPSNGGGGTSNPGGNGTNGLGGGGGGGTINLSAGGAGGSGVVIISYPTTYANVTSTTGSPAYSESGGNRIFQWTSSGSITL